MQIEQHGFKTLVGWTDHHLAEVRDAPFPLDVADPPGDRVVEREPPPSFGRLDSLRHALARHPRMLERGLELVMGVCVPVLTRAPAPLESIRLKVKTGVNDQQYPGWQPVIMPGRWVRSVHPFPRPSLPHAGLVADGHAGTVFVSSPGRLVA